MRSGILFFVSMIGIFQSPHASVAGEQSVLRNVRCVAASGHSRIEFSLAGTIRYSVEKEGNTVVFNFVATKAALSPGAARVGSRNGVIARILVDSIPGNIARVRVILRGDAEHRITEPDQPGLLFMDLYGDSSLQKTLPASFKHSRVKKQQPPLPESRTSSLVDIASIARSQVTAPQEKLPEQSSTETLGKTETSQPGAGLQKLNGTLFVIFLVAGVGVTVVGLVYLGLTRLHARQGAPQTKVEGLNTMPAKLESPPFEASQPSPGEHVPQSEIVDEPDPRAEADAHMVLFAERFHRSQGEFHLTYKLEKEKFQRSSVSRLLNNSDKVDTKSQRVKIAKKLGIGQGEVNLAFHLKGFQDGHVHGYNKNEKESV